jgi:hypothetical protein
VTAKRLISVAQRLDELAEEHDIPELATLSEEMGLVAERWPSERPNPDADPTLILEHLRLAYEIVEQTVRSGRYRDQRTWSGVGPSAYQRYAAQQPVLSNQQLIAALNGA